MPRFASDPPNVEAEVEGPDMIEHDPAAPIPAGYMLCEDGKLYRKRIVSGVQTIALAGGLGGPLAHKRAERAEAAMAAAINKAVSEGVPIGSPALTAIIIAARDAALNEE